VSVRRRRNRESGAGHEHRAGAGEEQQHPAKARVLGEIDAAAFDRAEGKRIDDRESLETGLDHEEATDLGKHGDLFCGSYVATIMPVPHVRASRWLTAR
jgi:hypothetical protein